MVGVELCATICTGRLVSALSVPSYAHTYSASLPAPLSVCLLVLHVLTAAVLLVLCWCCHCVRYLAGVTQQLGGWGDMVPPVPGLTRYKRELAVKQVRSQLECCTGSTCVLLSAGFEDRGTESDTGRERRDRVGDRETERETHTIPLLQLVVFAAPVSLGSPYTGCPALT